jgi:GT2 family glycosyltransferase
MHYTRGELVLHMDGDMELDPEWVDRSVSFILQHPKVAAVAGYYRNIDIRDDQIVGEQIYHRDPQDRILEADFVAAAPLFRRSAIEQVGGFNPYIRGEEDVELSMRLRHASYRLVRLPYLMCTHYGLAQRSVEYSLRRIRLSLWLGYGQVPRYHLRTGLLWTYLRKRRTTVAHFIGMLISLITLLLTLLFRDISFFGVWMLIVGVIVIAYWIKKRSLREALLSLLHQTLIVCSAIQGFVMTPRSPEEYPTGAEVVQVYYHRGGLA